MFCGASLELSETDAFFLYPDEFSWELEGALLVISVGVGTDLKVLLPLPEVEFRAPPLALACGTPRLLGFRVVFVSLDLAVVDSKAGELF